MATAAGSTLREYPGPLVPVAPPGAKDLPYSDGVEMETQRHIEQMFLLIHSLRIGWKAREDFYVSGNMFVYFSETQVKKNDFRGPDVFVVLGTSNRERLSWVVWEEEGKLPNVVIEITSPSTESVDRGEKMSLYAHRLKVSHYYLFDPYTKLFEGYLLNDREIYERIPPEPNGDLPCSAMDLRLGMRMGWNSGVETEWLRWIAPDGRVLPSKEDLADRATTLAEAESQRAEAAEAEVARLRAELDRLRAGS